MMVDEGPSRLLQQRPRHQPQPAYSNVHQDLGNVTIEHGVEDNDGDVGVLFVEEHSQSSFGVGMMSQEDDVLDIGKKTEHKMFETLYPGP